ncbi:DUF58 domain-containing protein [Nocardioides guangzhouensis]|uniref:DUF58 domain-containing protein n=1 Tax=Nocardioides guangzhouensis TaxID=2497878 RepID=A0A4Q4Z584_9ACTN|nr:DUF58 domain-containing protein [Nocardioides guangzhouensis]RYP82485.1 DUF58 domain-containing protein [Nocardioides guangzhouensis]
MTTPAPAAQRWEPTAALRRSTAVSALAVGFALVVGQPVVLVLATPLLLLTLLALVHRPASRPRIRSAVDHTTLHEGQGTVSRLVLEDVAGAEHVVRISGRAPYTALHPSGGLTGSLLRVGEEPASLEVSPRRWGRRTLSDEKVGLTSSWGGFRWGPVTLRGELLTVLPGTAPYDSRAEVPQPLGLVGAHRSRRPGEGTEFSGIRPFQAGDRLRRINWRVSLRSESLHVVATRGEEDSAVLVVLDAFAEHGASGGVDGAESCLDVGVRAASALAEHYVRRGDRVGLRVLSAGGASLSYLAGRRHLRRIQGTLARVRPGEPRDLTADRLRFGATTGTVVIVLSPMLHEVAVAATVTLAGSGLPVIVVDTLPTGATPAVARDVDPAIADLAWRMRLTDREELFARLARIGCPVVPWRGPGTLDEVLHRLARRAQLPRVATR